MKSSLISFLVSSAWLIWLKFLMLLLFMRGVWGQKTLGCESELYPFYSLDLYITRAEIFLIPDYGSDFNLVLNLTLDYMADSISYFIIFQNPKQFLSNICVTLFLAKCPSDVLFKLNIIQLYHKVHSSDDRSGKLY